MKTPQQVWEEAYPDRRRWDELEQETKEEWERVVGVAQETRLEWMTETPAAEGWYWIKAPNLSPRVDRFCFASWDKSRCYCPYSGGDILNLHGRPYEYAGPLPEPNIT